MSVPVIWANFAKSTLASGIGPSATTAILATGSGSLFPAPGAGQYFVAVLTDTATGLVNEVVHVTGLSSDTATLIRAQEGTTALPWAAGDKFANLVTAGALANVNSGQASIQAVTVVGDATYTSAQVLAGVINRSGPTGAYSDTTPSAASMVTAIPFCQVDSSFRLRIINTVAFPGTLLAGSGVTLSGGVVTYGSNWQDFLGVVTSVASPAVTLTNIGSGVVSS